MKNNLKLLFVSLGCDKNLVDTEFMLGMLRDDGIEMTDDEQEADIIIVNTCCFINDAKEESINTILEMAELKKEGKEAICYGMGDGLEAVERASEVGKNIVVSAAALEVAKYLEKTFGTPYEIGYPAAGELVPNLDYQGKKILVVHQQVMAEAIRQEILKRENSAEVQTATWFMRKKELACPQDVSLREEDDYIDLVKNGGFDIIFADACMEKMVPDFQGIFVNTRHFAVSGRLCE